MWIDEKNKLQTVTVCKADYLASKRTAPQFQNTK
jgi:hypothetical protein